MRHEHQIQERDRFADTTPANDTGTDPRRPVVIYARYSSELQNDRSIEDQVARCQRLIAPDERLSDILSDRAVSGAFIRNRPGIRRLLGDIEAGGVSVVITEGLDRLSRSQAEIAQIHTLACYHDTRIRTCLEGEVSVLHVGMNGTMNAMELDRIAERTRRGQQGSVRAGKVPGGLPYGYRVRYLNDEGVPEAGLREIDPAEAGVIRQIYEEYVDGVPVARIVRRLNGAGVPSPRGGKWSITTISGHYGRGNGILQNPVYRGLLVWNRHNFRKHPVTGKRRIRDNDPGEWVTREMPELRIVDEALWQAVQDRRAAIRGTRGASGERYPQPGFAIRCAACGGAMVFVTRDALRCADSKRHGTCSMRGRVGFLRLLALMAAHLERITREDDGHWRDAVPGRILDMRRRGEAADRGIAALEAKADRLLEAVSDGLANTGSVRRKLSEFDRRLAELHAHKAKLEDMPCEREIDRAAIRGVVLATREPERQPMIDTAFESVEVGLDGQGEARVGGIVTDLRGLAKLTGEAAGGTVRETDRG